MARFPTRQWTLVALFALANVAYAALPPGEQTLRDLENLTVYLHAHKGVSARLEHIDLVTYTMRLRGGCVVHFQRKKVERPSGWVGPASPLVFKEATCEIPRY